MQRTFKPNLLTGRKLPPRLKRMFKFANREFDFKMAMKSWWAASQPDAWIAKTTFIGTLERCEFLVSDWNRQSEIYQSLEHHFDMGSALLVRTLAIRLNEPLKSDSSSLEAWRFGSASVPWWFFLLKTVNLRSMPGDPFRYAVGSEVSTNKKSGI